MILKTPRYDGVYLVTTSYDGMTSVNGKTGVFSGSMMMVLKISRKLFEALQIAFTRSSVKKGNVYDTIPYTGLGLTNSCLEIRPALSDILELEDAVDLSSQSAMFSLPNFD